MGRARPDLIRVFWENPPGPDQGLLLRRRHGGREYETFIEAHESLTQIETAAVLRVSLMTVNRYVRSGVLRDHREGGISMIRLGEVKRFLKEKRRRGHQ
jgi:hypothetical protein